MKDKISEQRCELLHPKVRAIFKAFVEECENTHNVILRVTQGLRTIAEQNALYAQGRTKPGAIVTNAKGGSSYHNYGLAIDLVELKDGKANWKFDYKKLKSISQKYGLTWGGDFKSIKDNPHFELTLGYNWKKLLELTKENKVDKQGYVLI